MAETTHPTLSLEDLASVWEQTLATVTTDLLPLVFSYLTAIRVSWYRPILKPDLTFTLKNEWGSTGGAPEQFQELFSIIFDPFSGNLLVLDVRRIKTFTPQGQFLGSFSYEAGSFSYPITLAINPENRDIVVSDCGCDRVMVFSTDGKLKKIIGEGVLNNPCGVCFDPLGNYVITSTSSHELFVFSPDGEQLLQFGQLGKCQGDLQDPESVAVDLSGDIIVTEAENERIHIFDRSGKSIRVFGQRGLSEEDFGQGPSSLVVDRFGRIVVSSFKGNKILIFSKEGELLTTFQTQNNPEWPTIDGQGNIWVYDRAQGKIQQWG